MPNIYFNFLLFIKKSLCHQFTEIENKIWKCYSDGEGFWINKKNERKVGNWKNEKMNHWWRGTLDGHFIV